MQTDCLTACLRIWGMKKLGFWQIGGDGGSRSCSLAWEGKRGSSHVGKTSATLATICEIDFWLNISPNPNSFFIIRQWSSLLLDLYKVQACLHSRYGWFDILAQPFSSSSRWLSSSSSSYFLSIVLVLRFENRKTSWSGWSESWEAASLRRMSGIPGLLIFLAIGNLLVMLYSFGFYFFFW